MDASLTKGNGPSARRRAIQRFFPATKFNRLTGWTIVWVFALILLIIMLFVFFLPARQEELGHYRDGLNTAIAPSLVAHNFGTALQK